MPQPVLFKTIKLVTTTGRLPVADASNPGFFSAAGGAVFGRMGIMVKGVGGAATSWSVTLDGSLDGTNWTPLALHNAGDGTIVFAEQPVPFLSVNVASLTLGGASSITIAFVAAD